MIIIFYINSNVNIPYNLRLYVYKEMKHYKNDLEFEQIYHDLKMYFGLYKVEIYIQIFIQGVNINARPHSTHLMTAFLRQQGINMVPCLAFLSNFSSFQHLLDKLGRVVRQCHPQPQTSRQLEAALQEEHTVSHNKKSNLFNTQKITCICCRRRRTRKGLIKTKCQQLHSISNTKCSFPKTM